MTKDNVLLGKFELTGLPPAPRGVPQIEVTFEIDANGILNVGAEDKGTGKIEKITITADKGRLSEEEIAEMVRQASEFADEDKAFKEKIDAKNALEGFAYNMKNTIEDEDKLGGKISGEEKEKISEAIKEALDWLEEHSEADTEELKQRLKDLEAITNPIVSKLYQQAGGAGGAGGAPGGKGGDYYDEDSDVNHDEL